MKKIFIDANIYLNFFDSNKPELKKLLCSLLESKNSLFINAQIVNEVNRNKLGIAQKSLINHFTNLSNIKSSNLPEHLEMESTNLQSWNSQSKKIHQEQEALQKELEALIHKTLEEIMFSNDQVSRTFSLLFEGALEASEPEFQAARLRKELGNPPGKPNDPLGDQISWEQFLNFSRGSEKIWIITNDLDYYTVFKGKRYLNSFLYNELFKAKANPPSIFCFASLAEGLRHFNENSLEKIDNLPTDEELKLITEEELSSSVAQTEASRFFPVFEQGKLTYVYLPPGFKSPNHYIQYLRTYDSEEW
ncbi:PIN domain-containing protein [Synechocystis sp. PCC 7509]|uniref:PIN domain-containing protein n=1 Tax=Synechocystis sp. PCC 7509 TaxID=927677 RepID=UPI0002AD1A40|nr:PIN domain-containing protein [Synechocystis sp. PCC 7509]